MSFIDIVFDGPPGPVAGRFVEAENSEGMSISVGEWVQRPDGFWALRLPTPAVVEVEPAKFGLLETAVGISLSSLCRAVLNYVAHTEFGDPGDANWHAQQEYDGERLDEAARTYVAALQREGRR